MPARRQEVCANGGHNNWRISADGRKRRCGTCEDTYNAGRRALSNDPQRTNMAGRGPEFAYTWTDIMKARGYLG